MYLKYLPNKTCVFEVFDFMFVKLHIFSDENVSVFEVFDFKLVKLHIFSDKNVNFTNLKCY